MPKLLEIFAFGALPAYQQLYLLSFSSASDTFKFTLLLQQIAPPPSLQPLLAKLHAVWNFPQHLSPYVPLLSQFPSPFLTTFQVHLIPLLSTFLLVAHLSPHLYFRAHCLNGLQPFLRALRILLCGVLMVSLILLAIFPFFSTINIKRHMNSHHCLLFCFLGTLREPSLPRQISFFVHSTMFLLLMLFARRNAHTSWLPTHTRISK